ncbi:uncharacterized protein F5147DRAFT_779046 [Suillus discolor]|uniref:2OGFeDO JBP1/TET oxygenase domain-containing protein n=1 Tax=Suillus discolor TaxID=1912936 RepID=A0A9P7EVV6_9AGAM|nr:uncharacterized protein F5147DRAFT_779046 [Suillus discolor]KAG2094194.1 hypothetical protein F5147DRAFT_779046 [Suillus discolor]
MDLGLLDIDTCIALEQLANVMATAYSNAVHLKIDMVRYNDTLDKDESGRSEKREEVLFNKFPPEEEHFLTTPSVIIDSGGRIIVWYLPGALTAMMMKHGFLNLDPEDGFLPEVSAALKGAAGHNITASLQRSGIIVSAALQVMHPDLYWAGMETQVRLGKWAARYELDEMHHHLQRWTSVFNVVSIICNCRTPPHRDPKCQPAAFDIMMTPGVYRLVVMDFMNLGIKFLYDSGSILASSCRLVRHYMNVEEGNRIVTAWYMQDSIHNFVGTPSTEYAKYDRVNI